MNQHEDNEYPAEPNQGNIAVAKRLRNRHLGCDGHGRAVGKLDQDIPFTLPCSRVGKAQFEVARLPGGDPDGGDRSASSATEDTLTDSSATWTDDEWKDYTVSMIDGVCVGEGRRVLGNGADTLTLSDEWRDLDSDGAANPPSNGDGYHLYNPFRNNAASFDVYSLGPDARPDYLSDEDDDIANYKK